MSMSTCVVGFIPPDAKFRKMLAVYESCTAAGISPPAAVTAFFNDESPDPAGVTIHLSGDPKYKEVIKPWKDDMRGGYEIDLTKLPSDIKIVRFVNSW